MQNAMLQVLATVP